MINEFDCEIVKKQIFYQLDHWWPEYDKKIVSDCIKSAVEKMDVNYAVMSSTRYYNDGKFIFNQLHSLTWMIFLYKLSREIYLKYGPVQEADMLYYLNKIMHSVDWFYQVELPVHFMAEHPLGSVLGKAKYGDYLFVYQGTTIGGNRKNGILTYPILGNNVVLYANSTVLGETKIGDNVIISADTYIINDTIPDNSIVFGKSPNLIIKYKSEHEIKEMTKHIWKW